MFQRVLGVFLLVKVCFRDGWNIMCILAFKLIQIFFKKNYKCKLIFKRLISILAWWKVIKFFLEDSLLTKCNWSAILNGHVFLFGTSAVEYLLAIFLKSAIFSLFLYHNSFSPSEMILAFFSILAYSCAFRPLLTSPEPLSICGKLDFTAIDFLVEQALSVRCVQGDHVCVVFF